MIIRKNSYAISLMREAGKRLAQVFQDLHFQVIAGISTGKLDEWLEARLLKAQLHPECKGYGSPQFPAVSCISVNDEVVHGVPRFDRILVPGDLVKVDICASYNGYCADMARSYFVGGSALADQAARLVATAQEALDAGIEQARVGNRISDISWAIQKTVEAQGFGVVRNFAGHGIGKRMHEEPEILNYGKPGKGPIIAAGMAFALEPMITLGNFETEVDADGWTARTVDRSLAAHIEDTVVVTEQGPEIMTRL